MELFRTKHFLLKTSDISVVTVKSKLEKISVRYFGLFWSLQFLLSVLLYFRYKLYNVKFHVFHGVGQRQGWHIPLKAPWNKQPQLLLRAFFYRELKTPGSQLLIGLILTRLLTISGFIWQPQASCKPLQGIVCWVSYIKLSCSRLHLCPLARRALIQFNKIFLFYFPRLHFNTFSNSSLGKETRNTILFTYLYHVSFPLEIKRRFYQQNMTICNTVKKEKVNFPSQFQSF